MKLVVLQPSYLPWLGAFDQYAWADRYVIYDDVQFEKNSFRNRNRILTAQGSQWLTVPVKVRDFPNINEVEIDHSSRWARKHLESIRQAYARAPFFDWLFPHLQDCLQRDYGMLVDLTVDGLRMLTDLLGLPWTGVLSSSLGVPGKRTERLLGLCRHFAATDYLTGDAAGAYLAESVGEFTDIGVKVHWQDYRHPVYPQNKKADPESFVPYLSVIDLMFWTGPAALQVLVQPRP